MKLFNFFFFLNIFEFSSVEERNHQHHHNTMFRRLASTASVLCSSTTKRAHTRNLSIHEYQAQKLLKAFGVNCPNGSVAETPAEAEKIADVLSK